MTDTGVCSLDLLVVDPDPSFGETVAHALADTDRDVSVDAVTTADEAVGRLEGEPTVADGSGVHAGAVDGVLCTDALADAGAFVAEVRDAYPSLPVVALVADVDAPTVERLVEAGVTDYFPRLETRAGLELVADRVATDVSRRRAERRYEQIFHMAADSIALSDPDTGEILAVNQRLADLLGYDRSTLVGCTLHDISDTERGYTGELASERVAESLSSSGPERVEWALETSDGETRWIEANFDYGTVDGAERIVSVARDITDRKRRERALEEERGKYSTLVEQSNDGVVIVQDGVYAFVNRRFADITGYDAEAVQGMDFEEVIAEEHHDVVRERYERRIEGEEPPDRYDVQLRTADGDLVDVELTVSRIVHDDEPATMANFRDITERKRLEEELRERERRFRRIAEHVDHVIYLVDADLSEILYVNPAYEEVFGRPVEQLEADAASFLDGIHPDDREGYLDWRERIRADVAAGDTKERYEYTYRVRRPDGETRWIEATGYPVRDEDGEVTRFVGVSEDVTEERRRERTLESFQEATAELTAASDRAAVARRAVAAAEDVLGFPLVGLHLYDGDAGRLAPTATTDALAPDASTLPAFGPDDDPAWQVFVDGEAVECSGAACPLYPDRPDPQLCLPLGSHGIMLVGTAEDDIDEERVEFAQVLAATVEAALNHVEGRRELAAREAELAAEHARAERLDRLNTMVREIEQATVAESTREAIEAAVCDRLTAVEPYTAAWVGAVQAEGPPAVTSAAGSGTYGDRWDLPADGPGTHPAVEAAGTGEVRVAQHLARESPQGEWATRLLRQGHQAVLAVPLVHEETVHGVLTVLADDPTAFDEEERTVLAELGHSIGYEITVLQRQRALESDSTTELEFRVADDDLLFVALSDRADARVEFERAVRRADGAFSTFYTTEGVRPGEAASLVEGAPPVADVEVVSAADDEPVGLLEATVDEWFGAPFTERGAVIRSAWASDGSGRLVAEVPRATATRELVESFAAAHPDVELRAKRERDRAVKTLLELQDTLETQLTDRQLETLETAYSAGYFEWPRDSSAEDIADLLGITQPTFNKHLRAAERKTFAVLLDREFPE